MATVKDISSVKIKGANFQNETIFNLFSGKKVSLIYGENGAGKSTIARGIYNLANQTDNHGIRLAFLDSNEDELNIDDASSHIFVFDEDYIRRMVGIHSSTGLNSIVILGDLKDVEEKIGEQKLLLDKETTELQQEEDKLNRLTDFKNRESKFFIINNIYEKLREDGGWADRLRKIRNNKAKSKVNNSTIDTINSYQKFSRDIPETISGKREEQHNWINSWIQDKKEIFNTQLHLFQNTSQNALPISKSIYLGENSFNEVAFVDALAKVVEKPKITERDELILSIAATLQEKGTDFIKDVKNEFEKEKVERCPYCQQKIDPQRKKELIKALSKVLEVQTKNNVSNQLNQYRINEIPAIEWREFESLNKAGLVENCKNAIDVLKGKIAFVNGLLEKKINNPYQALIVETNAVGFNVAYESAIKYVQALNEAVASYNKAIKEHRNLEEKLEKLNNNIAFWEIYELTKELEEAKKRYELQEKNVYNLKRKISAIQKVINALEEKKKQVKIAVDEINASLAYIFLSTDRLQIEYDSSSNEYKIKVNHMDVKPEDVSVGERNAIALGYFFSDIKKEKEKKNFYQGEYFLVIDDPISSFDRENRIGVISLLRKELLKFKKGNKNTKILILTHDMQVLFDLHKMFDSMANELDGNESKSISYILEAKELKLTIINEKKYHEYSFLLQRIYEFAKEMSCENLNSEIGNMLRRVMEAYSTFAYKVGGTELFNKNMVLDKIKNEKHREFYRNCMIRLFLNGESHLEERVQSFNDMNFFSMLTNEKKQEYARYVLCFLYTLNPTHVLRHLETKDTKDVCNKKEWTEESLKKQLDIWLQQINVLAEASYKNN